MSNSIFKKDVKPRAVKYRTIRVREEVALQLDEWRDLFEDASISEVMWRVFSLARRELRRVKEKKKEAPTPTFDNATAKYTEADMAKLVAFYEKD